MGVRLHRDTFKNQDGDEYSIFIHEEGYNGASQGVPVRGVSLRYQGDDADIHAPILASSLEVTISVTSQPIEDALESMFGAAEGVWRVVLEKAGDIYWVGMVVTDQINLADAIFPYDYTLSAVDGLARLRKVDYTGSGAEWLGRQSILTHLHNALTLIPTDDLWGASDPYLKVHTTIFANNYDGEAYTVNPLEGHQIGHAAVRTINSDGETEYISAYEILAQLAWCWGSRLYLADGAFHFEQLTGYARTDTNIYVFPYDKTSTAQTAEQLNDWGARRLDVGRSDLRLASSVDATVESGAVNRFLAPLLEARVQYKHYSTRNIIDPSSLWTQATGSEVETEVVDADPARILVQARYSYRVEFDNNTTPFPLIRGWYKFRCKLKIGSNWCQRTANFVNGIVTYTDATWETSEAWIEFFAPSEFLVDDSQRVNYLNFRTPPNPASSELFVDFEFVDLYDVNGALADSGATAHAVIWTIDQPYVEIYFDGTAQSRYRFSVHTATNSNTGNSEILERELLFGTGPQAGTYGRIRTDAAGGNEDAGEWSNWPTVSTLDHSALIAREYLTPRTDPAKVLEGRLRGIVGAHNLIDRSGERFVFMGGTVDLADASTDGTWVYITDVADSVVDPTDPVDSIREIIQQTFTGGIQPFEPTGPEVQPLIALPVSDPFQDASAMALPTAITFDHATDTTDDAVDADTEITTLDISEQGVEVPWQDGDTLYIVDPYTGVQQLIEVDEDEATGAIAIAAVTPTHDFPQGSLVVPTNDFLWRLLNKVRRIPMRFPLLAPKFEIAYTITQFDQFWRVPAEWNGYKLAAVEAAVFQTGTAVVDVDVVIGVDTYTATVASGTETGRTVLGTYRALATDDLVSFGVSSVGAGTYPQGLTVTIIAIALI